jgi:transcription elongation factor Elf1
MGEPSVREVHLMSTPRCSRCAHTLVSISITISGQRRTMRSCSSCGYRGWYAGEAAPHRVELSGVLEEISDERRANAPRR